MREIPHSIVAGELAVTGNEPVNNILPLMTPIESSADQRIQRQLLISNTTQKPLVWRFSTELLKPSGVEFYQLVDARRSLLFRATNPRFSPIVRLSQGRVIASGPIILPAQQTMIIVGLFDSAALNDYFPVSFLPEAVFVSSETRAAYWHGWYLGGVLTFIVYFLTFSYALSSPSARLYALYFLILSTLTFHSFGYTQSLLPGATDDALYFTVFRTLQIALCLSYLVFAVSFINARINYPFFYRFAMAYLVLASVVFIIVETLDYRTYFIFVVDLLAAGFISLGVYFAHIAVLDSIGGARLFALGFAVLLSNGVINYASLFPPFQLYNDSIEVFTLCLRVADTSLSTQLSTNALIRMLSNLVSNAIKYTDYGTVLVGARRRSGGIMLQVWDTGHGIAEEELQRVIKPYERISRDSNGFGLGLDIVYQLAALHGLTVTVNSREQSGTVVCISGLVCTAYARRH